MLGILAAFGHRAREAAGRSVAALFLSLLASCGGGGGGGAPSVNTPARPPLEWAASTGAVSFLARQGDAAPPSQDIIITITRGTGFVFVGPASAGFFSWSASMQGGVSTVIRVTPQAPTTAGEFNATLPVYICHDGACNEVEATLLLSVHYQVLPEYELYSLPTSVDFDTSAGLSPSSRSLQLTVSSGAVLPWSHTLDYGAGPAGWLTVSPASATSAATPVTLQADASGLPLGRHTASVTFTAGNATRQVPVSVTVHPAGVNFVSPYLARTGTSVPVVVRGHGFLAFANDLEVRIGGLPTPVARVVSDTEIRATVPSRPAGSHAVTVGNATTTLPTRARMLVRDALTLSYAALPRPAGSEAVGSLIFDTERLAVYLTDAYSGRLEAYRFNGTGWTASPPVRIGESTSNERIALSPDGTELIKTAGARLWHVDPATLAATGSVDAAQGLRSANTSMATNMIEFANDGHAIGSVISHRDQVHLYRYNILTRQFAEIPTPRESARPDMPNRHIVASGDGSVLLLPSFWAPDIYSRPLYWHDTSTHLASEVPIRTTPPSAASLTRDGAAFLMMSAGRVWLHHTSTWGTTAALPDPDQNLQCFAISPDGGYAYAYYSNGMLRTLRLSAPQSGVFVDAFSARAVADAPGTYCQLRVSPDGSTLILAGSQRVIVMPAR